MKKQAGYVTRSIPFAQLGNRCMCFSRILIAATKDALHRLHNARHTSYRPYMNVGPVFIYSRVRSCGILCFAFEWATSLTSSPALLLLVLIASEGERLRTDLLEMKRLKSYKRHQRTNASWSSDILLLSSCNRRQANRWREWEESWSFLDKFWNVLELTQSAFPSTSFGLLRHKPGVIIP